MNDATPKRVPAADLRCPGEAHDQSRHSFYPIKQIGRPSTISAQESLSIPTTHYALSQFDDHDGDGFNIIDRFFVVYNLTYAPEDCLFIRQVMRNSRTVHAG
jgi:hypothetical protein